MDNLVYRRSEQALHAEVNDDIVALHIANGHCYGMENVAAEIWTRLEQPSSLDELCNHLVTRFDVDAETCSREIAPFLDQLRREGLVETVEA